MTRYQMFLAALFAAVWVVTAIDPLDRGTWLLENLLVIAFVPVVFVTARYFKLSELSYTCITLFLILHLIGAHWTYGEVPFGYTMGEWLGTTRNMYDRLLHFLFGLLMAYPIREIFLRTTNAKGFWGYYFPLDIILSFSAIYEILEWLALNVVDGSVGVLFLATQGDVFDPAKDMGAALLGGLITMLLVLILNFIFNKDTRQEVKQSFKIDYQKPEGRQRFRDIIR
jgi:putative membrane protein